MFGLAPRFSILADLSKETSSEGRREILRKVTETFDQTNATDDTLTSLNELLASVAADYSTQVRAELAQLVAANPHFGRTAEKFVLDDIEVAGPELLNELYVKVEASLRQEIIRKLDAVSPDEIDKAFQRSRHRITKKAIGLPDDFAEAQKRLAELAGRGSLSARSLVTLMREGKGSRTTFISLSPNLQRSTSIWSRERLPPAIWIIEHGLAHELQASVHLDYRPGA
jgi:uncharacterized protein (DUF2336 family)